MLKMAIITGFLSRTKDRFHEYNQPLELDQKFKLMTTAWRSSAPTK
jgi:xylose isomerase